MREQLIQYVELLFAGAPHAEEIKQEILQNTLDRYDDLVAQGKSPEAAYRLAISGIGDINEILSSEPAPIPEPPVLTSPPASAPADAHEDEETPESALRGSIGTFIWAVGLAAYFLLSFTTHAWQMTWVVFLITAAVSGFAQALTARRGNPSSPKARKALYSSIGGLIWAVGLTIFFILSFETNAWYLTWLVIPITGSVHGLIRACLDLKEAKQYEN